MNDNTKFKKQTLDLLYPPVTIEKAHNGFIVRQIKPYEDDPDTSREIIEVFEGEEEAFVNMCWTLLDIFQLCGDKRIAIKLVDSEGNTIEEDLS